MSASPFEPKRQSVPRGIAFRLISVGSYSLMAALLKQASEHGVVAGEMLFYRAIFALPVVLFWALKSRGISVGTFHAAKIAVAFIVVVPL